MKTKQLVIFGTAEIAQLANYYFQHDSNYNVVAFTVDDEFCDLKEFEGLPVVPFSKVTDKYPASQFEMHVALSYKKLNKLREEKYYQAKDAGYKLATYICSKATTWPDLTVGDNCFILEDQTIQPTVKIGNNVMLWSGNHIGHGTVIEDHVYLASHICISGHSVIGERCFIGVNATFRDFCEVGEDCFIGMDASVSQQKVAAGSVILTASSKTLQPDDKLAKRIKTAYFGL